MNELYNHLDSLIISLQKTGLFYDAINKFIIFFNGLSWIDIQVAATSAITGFALIFTAEIGDKSQLVCMALASKHRPAPVISGAVFAFALLNAVAVSFGTAIAHWLPDYVIAATVAFLFIVFGVQALRTTVEDSDADIREKSGHSIFLTTFLLITVAEFGDKTQLAVVALSSTGSPFGVWLGATLALGATSALGVVAGRKLLQKVPLELLHKIGGFIFLALSVFAVVKAYQSYFIG